MKPKRWTEVYPQGTKEGNEEQKFFIALTRHPKGYTWRSTAALAKESGLSKERVEAIISKYYKMGIVLQHSTKEDHWGYWEMNPDSIPKKKKSLREIDHEERIKEALRVDDK